MTWAERAIGIVLVQVPAVQGARSLAQAVHVLHDVDLAGGRPPARGQHPEPRPVAHRAGRAGLLDRRRYHHLTAGRRREGAPGPDPGRRPGRVGGPGGTVAEHDQLEAAVAVELGVVLRRGHRLDLAGTEDPPAGVEVPDMAVDWAVGWAVEIVRPDLFPWRGRFGADRRRA